MHFRGYQLIYIVLLWWITKTWTIWQWAEGQTIGQQIRVSAMDDWGHHLLILPEIIRKCALAIRNRFCSCDFSK